VSKTSSSKVNPRSTARDFAAQFLYQVECERVYFFSEAQFHAFCENFSVKQDVVEYLRELCRGVLNNIAEIDAHLTKHSQHWRVERMPVTDRNILRLAFHELTTQDTPPRVVINEAIELAKKYGNESSGSFVNAVLDRLARDCDSLNSNNTL